MDSNIQYQGCAEKSLAIWTETSESRVAHVKPIWNNWKILLSVLSPYHKAFSSILAHNLLPLPLRSTLFGKVSVPRDIEISWRSVPGGLPHVDYSTRALDV